MSSLIYSYFKAFHVSDVLADRKVAFFLTACLPDGTTEEEMQKRKWIKRRRYLRFIKNHYPAKARNV